MKFGFLVSTIMLASVTLATSAYPAQWVDKNPIESVTVDYLYEACSATGNTARGKIPYFDCASYIYGVLDSYRSIQEYLPKSKKACLPHEIAPWKVLEDFEYLINKNGAKNAAQALINEFQKKYPCG
jgi:hypothetical protein